MTSSQVSVEPLLSNDPPFAETEMPETAEPLDQRDQVPQFAKQKKTQHNPRLPTGNEYGPNNLAAAPGTRSRDITFHLRISRLTGRCCVRIIEGLSVFITFPEITCPDTLVCMLLRLFSCSSFLVVILFVLICYHPRCSAKIQHFLSETFLDLEIKIKTKIIEFY